VAQNQGANLVFCGEEVVMKFCGIDLHSNNSAVVVTDEPCPSTEVKAGVGIANDLRPLACFIQGRSL
jgi:hypothetical protein